MVVVVGDTIALTGETRSTATLELQGGQVALLDALATTGTPVIVVLMHSKPAALPASALGAAAIIEAFNPGMRGGQAVAELVLGLIEPSGRMPLSRRRATSASSRCTTTRSGASTATATPTSPRSRCSSFGEGLSYSTVEYSDLDVAATRSCLPTDVVQCPGHADEHRHPPGAGDRPGLHQRPRDQRDVGGEGAQGLAPGPRAARGIRQVTIEVPARLLLAGDGRRAPGGRAR